MTYNHYTCQLTTWGPCTTTLRGPRARHTAACPSLVPDHVPLRDANVEPAITLHQAVGGLAGRRGGGRPWQWLRVVAAWPLAHGGVRRGGARGARAGSTAVHACALLSKNDVQQNTTVRAARRRGGKGAASGGNGSAVHGWLVSWPAIGLRAPRVLRHASMWPCLCWLAPLMLARMPAVLLPLFPALFCIFPVYVHRPLARSPCRTSPFFLLSLSDQFVLPSLYKLCLFLFVLALAFLLSFLVATRATLLLTTSALLSPSLHLLRPVLLLRFFFF